MLNRKQDKALNQLQQTSQSSQIHPRQQMQWLLRGLLIARKQCHTPAGFILPTVTMVLLVVMTLTTVMMLRSFDRSRNASSVRASQAAINAATPAIARAKVKIEQLLQDPTLPSRTPSAQALYDAVKTNSKYTLGDETRLKLAFDLNQDNTIQADNKNLENDETLTTAWRFGVDTDNNGKFDSYTLYGIYFRSPSRATSGDAKGDFNRARNPLEARTPPIAEEAIGSRCADLLANSDSLAGDSSWYRAGNKLKKSFFVYTATVPITDNTGLGEEFEVFEGNRSFYALEYQQDQRRIPLNNYAAWFNNDLELTPNADFRLNGKVHTNGNLLVGGHNNASVRFYQVSSNNSCFYQQENGKITVGGNVGTGSVSDTVEQKAVDVDLFDDNPGNGNPQIGGNNKSTESSGGSQIAYNDAAYNQRLALMKRTAISYCVEAGGYCSETNPPRIRTVLAIARYPEEVKTKFSDRVRKNYNLNPDSIPSTSIEEYTSLDSYKFLAEEIELYLKNRTRRVPFAEVATLDSLDATRPYSGEIDPRVFLDPNSIEPPAEWREPTYINTKLQLKTSQLEATLPDQQKQDGKETYLGDRISVGNNLPAYWKDGDNYVTASKDQQWIEGINWTEPDDKPRYRSTQIQQLDLDISDRDGFWEEKAAGIPSDPITNNGDLLATTTELANGGLRIITGAGIYRNQSSQITAISIPSFLSPPSNLDGEQLIPNAPLLAGEGTATPYTLVWSDTLPMTGGSDNPQTPNAAPPDLRMRATAIYHYKDISYTDPNLINRTPTACISSYYDPTNSVTARNPEGLPDVSGDLTDTSIPQPGRGIGRSNNGVVYAAPYTTNNGRIGAIATYLPELKAQAKMMFPNGRIVNEPLQNALRKLSSGGALADSSKPLSLAENSAIDTAICALKILDNSIQPLSNPVIPHGAIKEASFLDGREVKALSQDSSTDYNLDLEQRQPLEIRVTEINLDTEISKGITRKQLFGTDEYLLPNSGAIYASRDDALRDDSSSKLTTESKLLSPTDFKLDSTRRPNGIRLINGSNLSRTNDNRYRQAEKGLILVSNLPVYIQGDFNLHQTPAGNKLEEFLETLSPSNWSNFYTRAINFNSSFACRPGRAGCPSSDGDTWRPATVIADAVTLLSGTFKDGVRAQGDYDLNNHAGSSERQLEQSSPSAQAPENSNSPTQKRQNNGFWDNSFVPSALWSNIDNSDSAYPVEKTSYLTNGVTPVQRRTNFSEYVMEICRKIPVETCGDGDWVVGYDGYVKGRPPNGKLEDDELKVTAENLFDGSIREAKVELLGAGTTARPALIEADRRYARRVAFVRSDQNNNPTNNQNNPNNRQNNNPTNSPANTPANSPTNSPTNNPTSNPTNSPTNNPTSNPTDSPTNSPNNTLNINLYISQNFNPGGNPTNNPNRNPNSNPTNSPNSNQDKNAVPVPLGIGGSGTVQKFPYREKRTPRQVPNALWFKTTDNPALTQGGTYSPNNPLFIKEVVNSQPLLVPVLQIHSPDGSPNDSLDQGSQNGYVTNWLQTAEADTTFNATFVSGNSPSRPQEESAGLPNFVRFLENWQGKTVNINGNFIQLRRSNYATAPFVAILRDTAIINGTSTDNLSLFDYPMNIYRTNNGTPAGTLPYYNAPIRQWGFDVALLSQSPDLFAQHFTMPSPSAANDFIREVGRDDPWIQTLLCAATASDRLGAATATYTQYAVPDKNQRPAGCQNDAPNYPANDSNQVSS